MKSYNMLSFVTDSSFCSFISLLCLPNDKKVRLANACSGQICNKKVTSFRRETVHISGDCSVENATLDSIGFLSFLGLVLPVLSVLLEVVLFVIILLIHEIRKRLWIK